MKLTWKASESDYFQRYNLKVGTSPLDNPEIEVGDVANFFGESGLTEGEWYELGNLSPDTKYYAYVQYDCGDGDVSPWAELEFKTLCEAVAVPFYEDFEKRGLSPEVNFCEEDLMIKGNEVALRRVVQNLVKNALEHGKNRLGMTLEKSEGNLFKI